MSETHDVAILGASGYTGAELVRLIATHPGLRIAALTADRKAGQSMGEVFPHLRHLDLPALTTHRRARLRRHRPRLLRPAARHEPGGDRQAAAEPQGRRPLRRLPPARPRRLRALVRPSPPRARPAGRGGLRPDRVLPRRNPRRAAGRRHRLQRGDRPLRAAAAARRPGSIDPDDIIIDLATGVSGAGRSPKEGMLHSEVSEGYHAYNVAKHRHLAEFDQEFARAAGRKVEVTFVPHLLPQNRGILATIYVRGEGPAIHAALGAAYADEPFIVVLPYGEAPATRHVRGSNFVHLGVIPDRRPGRVMVFSALDNLDQGIVRPGDPERQPDARPARDHGADGGAAVSVRRLRRGSARPLGGDGPVQPQRRLVDVRLHRLLRPAVACSRS